MTLLIDVVFTLVLLGVALYLLPKIPMDSVIMEVIRVIVIVVAIFYVIGLLTGHSPRIWRF